MSINLFFSNNALVVCAVMQETAKCSRSVSLHVLFRPRPKDFQITFTENYRHQNMETENFDFVFPK